MNKLVIYPLILLQLCGLAYAQVKPEQLEHNRPKKLGCQTASGTGGTYYVATTGNDIIGDGSLGNPWATLSHAIWAIPDDGSTVVVLDGIYNEPVNFNRQFAQLATFRAANPYRAQLTASPSRPVTVYGGRNIIIEGFEIFGQPGQTDYYLVYIGSTGGGSGAENVMLFNNIIHDSYYNDLIKIVNRYVRYITIKGNLLYNPHPYAAWGNEHLDINTCTDVIVEENILLNDYEWSGRVSNNQLHPFVLIKNSGSEPISQRFIIRRNVFLNWDGRPDQPFLLLGEDGQPFHEAQDVLIENNLFIGNSDIPIDAAFGIKCAKNVTFRANTVVGDLPCGNWAYAMRINLESPSSPLNENIFFYNNIWSDPTGTMTDFSDGSPEQTTNAILDNNLYWNGGNPIPTDGSVLNITDDTHAIIADPLLGDQAGLVLPRWLSGSNQFITGNTTIRQEFERLVTLYGAMASGSPAIDAANPGNMPADDILGNSRAGHGTAPDIGAYEFIAAVPTPTPTPTVSPTPTPTLTPTATPTATPTGCVPILVKTWAFEPPPNGWSYNTAAPLPGIPPWSHATSVAVTGPGAIGINAGIGETTDYYGSWDNYSGDPAIPAISWVDNSVWRAIYKMSTSKSDPDSVPSVRLRLVENQMKATSYVQLFPGSWIPLTQRGSATTDYALYLHPPITDNGFFLAFDLIDFGQPYGVPCDGTVYLEEVMVDRFDLTDPCFDDYWTTVTTYSGSGLYSWTHSSAGLPYLTDVDFYMTATDGLQQATTLAQTRAFGAWSSPIDEIDIVTTPQLYRAKWTLACENSTTGSAERVRLHTQDFRYASYMVIDRDADPANSALPPSSASGGKDYYLYAEFPGTPTVDKLLLAWDLFDFDPAAGGWAKLTNVVVNRRNLP